MNNPTISVVMPVYNGEKFLPYAIESILQQSFTDFEFIIINDGSTDNTEKIILEYNDPRIVYIKNEKNLKLIKTLNKGIALAQGKYVARMDADDISFPTRFEKQINIFNFNNDIDIVNANAYHLEEDGKYFREQRFSMTLNFETIRYLIPLQNFICHPVVMVKSNLLKRYKYIDDQSNEHIEDFDLWNRMLGDECICYTIDQCLLYYRNNDVSINHIHKDKQVAKMYSLCNNVIQKRFNFKISKESFMTLLDDTSPTNYFKLKTVNDEILLYINSINNNCVVSSVAYQEMNVWRKQKLVLLSLKSLVNSHMFDKIGILIFVLRNLSWLSNLNIIRFIKKAIYPKYLKMNL